jgi:ankyrin repeat protein
LDFVTVDYKSVLRVLLERKANVNAVGGKYGTALQCASKHGLVDAVQLLLEHGADPAISGGKFGSALDAAREKKHWHVFDVLERYMRKHAVGK